MKNGFSSMIVAVALLTSWWSTSSANGAITADFDGAAGDGYPGTAGNGWGGGWVSIASGSSSSTAVSAVGSAYGAMSPGGGNYLGNYYTISSFGYFNLSRQYVSSPAEGVDLTKPYTLTFEFRLDSAASDFRSAYDQIAFDDDTVGGSLFESNPTWVVGVGGAASGSIPARDFVVVDGNRAGTGTAIDTDIALTSGTVYTFSVTSDPQTQSWNFAMSDGTQSFDANGLGWRGTSTSVGGYFNVLGESDLETQPRHFDIDSVTITQAPEPGSTVGIFIACGAVLLNRHLRS